MATGYNRQIRIPWLADQIECGDQVFQERYVGFIDILGFSALVRSAANAPQNIQLILRALQDMKALEKRHNGLQDARTTAFRAQNFSDSIVMSSEVSPNGLWYLMLSVDALCFGLLQAGLFTRGGVSKGLLYHDDEVVFGPGLLDAYHLESQIARHPRVIVGRDVYRDANSYCDDRDVWKTYFDSRILRADDGPAFLHVLLDLAELNRTPMSQSTEGASDHPLIGIGKNIRAVLKERLNSTMDNPEHFKKTRWFVDYWNRAVAPAEEAQDHWLLPISIAGGMDDQSVAHLPFRHM